MQIVYKRSLRFKVISISFILVCAFDTKKDVYSCFRDIFLEKHWRSVLSRSVCDYFFEAQGKVSILLNLNYQHEYIIVENKEE